MLPPTILTEAIAQVGAILILAKPENRQRLPFFAGIERVRYRRPVHPGDVVEIEAVVLRLRSRMGLLKGVARVDGKRGRRRHDDVRARARQSASDRRLNRSPAPVLHCRAATGLRHTPQPNGGTAVLETIAIILLVLWLLGVVSGYTLGNFIYVLLVIAIVLFLVRLVSGRRVV